MINKIIEKHPTCKKMLIECANPDCRKPIYKWISKIDNAHEEAAFCCSRKCKNSRYILDHHNALKIKLHGFDNPFNVKEIQEKCQKHNPFKTKEGQQKCREGMIKKYGVPHALQLDEIKQKTKNTQIEKYGSIKNFHKHVKDKTLETQKAKYGTWFFGSPEGKMTIEALSKIWGYSDDEIKDITKRKVTNKHGNKTQRSKWADKCISTILNEIDTKDMEVRYGDNELILQNNDKTFLYDLTIGNKIIEFNGDYWHANPNKYDENYKIRAGKEPKEAKYIWERDRQKIECAKLFGYTIYIIWEQDYKENPENCISNAIKFIKGKTNDK